MCDPVTISTIALVGSTALGAYSSIQQGKAQYKTDMYNAQVAENNAQSLENDKALTQESAAIDRRRLGERVRAEKGQLIADASAMGIDPQFGTPADLIGDVNQSYSVDRYISGKNEITDLQKLDQEQADYRSTAAMYRSSAKGALKAGYLGAAGSLLQGVSSVSSDWIDTHPTTKASTASGTSSIPTLQSRWTRRTPALSSNLNVAY